MKKLIKYLFIVPLYIILILLGFIGWGGPTGKDIWDKLKKWIDK